MRLIIPAGVWEVPIGALCIQCGGPGGHTYLLEQTDPPHGSFCDTRCWGHWWDAHVKLTGEPSGRFEPPAPFQGPAWAHAVAELGETDPARPGITRHTRRNHKLLVYRDPSGKLVGLLRRSDGGAYHVFVDPARRGQGIGKALMRAAGREWGVDRSLQHLTVDGAHLTNRILPKATDG